MKLKLKILGYSDHDAQILTIIRNANNDTINNTRMSRVFSKSKIKLFIDYLLQESWDAVYNTIDTNDKYYSFFFQRFHFILTLAFLFRKEN